MSPVVEHLQRSAVHDGVGKQHGRHVGTPPRAIYRKKPQTRGGQIVNFAEHVRHQLIGLFRRRIKRNRMVNRLVGGKRHVAVHAIHTARTGIHQMFHIMDSALFKNIRKTNNIAFDISCRIFNRIANRY